MVERKVPARSTREGHMQSSSESSNQTTQTQYFYEFTTITIGHEAHTHAPASSRHQTPTSTTEHHQHQSSDTVPGMSASNSQPRTQASGRTDYSHSLHLDDHPLSSALRQYRHRQLSRHRYQLQSTSPAASAASAASAALAASAA